MATSILGLSTTRPRSRTLLIIVGVVLVCTVLLGLVFAGEAQAAVSYSASEIAFIDQLNQYRAANGLQPLLLSDMISEACDRHGSDMGKYAYFSHYSLKSDWFAYNATPWDRMALSGYNYNTSKAENIAAGQATAADVFTAWKNSSGHNTNMLGSAYKVIGVSQVIVPGSPYTSYWVTDFGGYVDATAHAPGQPPAPTTTRYQQTDSRLVYSTTWGTYYTSSASGGGYKRVATGSSSVTVTFSGTYLAWIATKGTTLGKAYVSLDGGTAQLVDLARPSVAYQQKVWSTGTLANTTHTVKIWRDPKNLTGKFISVDAFDVVGALVQSPSVVSPATNRYEQTDLHLAYWGDWEPFYKATASGKSYGRADTGEASVTITFAGTYLGWIATAGTTLGKAYVSLDGGTAQSVDLARPSAEYQQEVWSTGTLANTTHTVKIWRDPKNLTGKFISVDAIELEGTIN